MSVTGMNPTVRRRFVCASCGVNTSLWLCEHFSEASAPDAARDEVVRAAVAWYEAREAGRGLAYTADALLAAVAAYEKLAGGS